MTFGINPIAADATRNALVEGDRKDAKSNGAAASRAALDVAELRELERSLYAPAMSAPVVESDPVARASGPVARRSLVDRLLRRR